MIFNNEKKRRYMESYMDSSDMISKVIIIFVDN